MGVYTRLSNAGYDYAPEDELERDGFTREVDWRDMTI